LSKAATASDANRSIPGIPRTWRFEEYALLLILRQEPAWGPQTHRRPDGVHLRWMRWAMQGHHL